MPKELSAIRTSRLMLLLLFVLAVLLTASCGVNPPEGAAANTQPLSPNEFLFIQKGCIACHTVKEGEAPEQTGPTMVGVVARSNTTLQSPDYTGSAKTVEEYFQESILMPEIHLVPEYEPLMPPTYEAMLTEQEIANLVDYMLTFE